MTEDQSAVFDLGTGRVKCGFAGDECPRVVVPTVIGKPKNAQMHGLSSKTLYVSESAIQNRGVCTLDYPISEGIINNFSHVKEILHHCIYNNLRIEPSQYNALLTEAPLNPKSNREKLATICFEDLDFAKFYISLQAVLTLFGNGRTTGLVVDSGDGVTHCVPCFEGYMIAKGIVRNRIAGRFLGNFFLESLNKILRCFYTSGDKDICRDIKEKVCYVSLDYEEEKKQFENNPSEKEAKYELPDGNDILIGLDRIRCCEVMYSPSLHNEEAEGLDKLTETCIKSCDMDLVKPLSSNIIPSGGNTMFTNYCERLQNSVQELVSSRNKINVIDGGEGKAYCVFVGGSILTSLSSFSDAWVTKEEYNEVGGGIVHQKCT